MNHPPQGVPFPHQPVRSHHPKNMVSENGERDDPRARLWLTQQCSRLSSKHNRLFERETP
jgi:hypothetical protein